MILSKIPIGIILFDLAFLPMIHLAGIPFKISYLMILLNAMTLVNRGRLHTNNITKTISISFILLATATIVGHCVFIFWYGGSEHSETIRSVLIYLMAPAAIWTGYRQEPHERNYLIFFVIGYALITILYSAFYQSLPLLTNFYDLQDRLQYYSDRSQGLFQNANISALFMTLLYMYVVVGMKYKSVKVNSLAIITVCIFTVGTILLLGSRNQMIAAAIITLASFTRMISSKAIFLASILILCILFFSTIFNDSIDKYAQSQFEYQPISAIKRSFLKITSGNDPSQINNSLKRPIMKLEEAMDRTKQSPFIGSGFDSIENTNFRKVLFHNDWLYVMSSAGIIGLLLFVIIIFQIAKVDLILTIPFFLPGMTNSFLFSPSNMMLLMILIGMVSRHKDEIKTINNRLI